MTQVRRTELARRDLIDIWQTIAADNAGAADRVFARLENRINTLKMFPAMGMARPDIAAEARVLVQSPYLILCRIVADGIEIVRVLHGARNIDEILFNAGAPRND